MEWDFTGKVTSDMTLFAYWQPITYTVTFDSNGGSTVDDMYVSIEEPLVFSEIGVASRTGEEGIYGFMGWFYSDGAELVFDENGNAVVLSNTTLYAHWLLTIDASLERSFSLEELKRLTIRIKTLENSQMEKAFGITGLEVIQDAGNGFITLKIPPTVTKDEKETFDFFNDALEGCKIEVICIEMDSISIKVSYEQ